MQEDAASDRNRVFQVVIELIRPKLVTCLLKAFKGESEQVLLVQLSDEGLVMASLTKLDFFLGKEVPHFDGQKGFLLLWIFGRDSLVHQRVG